MTLKQLMAPLYPYWRHFVAIAFIWVCLSVVGFEATVCGFLGLVLVEVVKLRAYVEAAMEAREVIRIDLNDDITDTEEA